MIVFPLTSIVRAPAGIETLPRAPMPTMRLSFTTMSPFGMISSPFIVMMRAPRSATTPRGLSFCAVISTSYRCGS